MFFQKIFPLYSLSREIKELYTSVAIKDFAVSMVALFEPIFLYHQLNFPLYLIMLFYALIYTPYIFLLPFSGKIAARFGFEHSMAYSTPFFIIYLGLLYASQAKPSLVWVAALVICVYKIFYWPSYNANFAHYSSQESRGKILSSLKFLSTILIILGPLVGGLILKFFSFSILFIVASLLIIASFIPLFTTREKFKPSHFSYWASMKRIFSKRYLRQGLSFLGFAEELLIMTLWPIFIFLVLQKNFLVLGIIAALSSMFFSFFSLWTGSLVDQDQRIYPVRNRVSNGVYKIFRPAVILNSLIWILKIGSKTIFKAGFLDITHWGARGILFPSQFSLIYKQANQRGNLKYMVFHEMTLALGKAGIAWILFLVFWNSTDAFSFAFALSAILGLLYLLL